MPVPFSKEYQLCIRWWLQERWGSEVPLKVPTPILYTKSRNGWGVYLRDLTTAGTWPSRKELHTVIEMKAFQLAVNAFPQHCYGLSQKAGGTVSPDTCRLADVNLLSARSFAGSTNWVWLEVSSPMGQKSSNHPIPCTGARMRHAHWPLEISLHPPWGV